MSEYEPRDSKLIWLWLFGLTSLGLLAYNYFSMWDMMSTVVLLVLVLVIVGLTLQEGTGDEREAHLKLLASRIGFMVGLVILSWATVVEVVVNHQSAPWLVYALAGMTLGKIIGLIYGRLKH